MIWPKWRNIFYQGCYEDIYCFYSLNWLKLYNYIISKQNLSNKIHNIMKYSLFVILGFYLLLLIVAASVFFGITSFGASGFSLVCEKNKNDADNELTYKVIFIIFIVLNILFLIVNYILSCIIVDCYNKIISNLNNKGNDIYIDALIDKILENHSSTYDFAKDIVIIMSFIPIAILVFLCLNYFCCLRWLIIIIHYNFI